MDAPRTYIRHFNLIAEPFIDAPDRRSVWFGEKHLEVLANLKVGVEQTKGVILLTGAAGSGKSVLVERFLKIITGDFKVAVLGEPGIDASRFFEFLAQAFSIEGEVATKGDFLIRFKEFLKMSNSRGVSPLLVVESADQQTDEILEQIRLLSNIEEGGQKLLTVLLIGTGRLSERLAAHKHRALLQRLAVRCKIEALTEFETRDYIRHRMMIAGSFLPVFTNEAVRLIHRFSGGLPKLINLVCEHALINACREKRRSIDEDILRRYIKTMRRGLDLERGVGLASLREGGRAAEIGRPSKGRVLGKLAVLLVSLLCLFMIAGIVFEVRNNRTPAPAGLPAPVRLRVNPGPNPFDAKTTAELGKIAGFLRRSPDLNLVIKGYAEENTPPAEAYPVSRNKSDSVKDHLAGQGVNPDRVIALGLGSEVIPGSAAPGEMKSRIQVEVEFAPVRSR